MFFAHLSSNFFILTISPLKPLIRFRPYFTGMIPRCFSTKVVQLVLIGCISWSRCHNISFQIATFKNLLVWNYKAQSFHIWYIALSRGLIPKLFKLSPWGQNWPRLGSLNFTLKYIRKTSNNFFSWTANGNLTKQECSLGGPFQNCSNDSDWLLK